MIARRARFALIACTSISLWTIATGAFALNEFQKIKALDAADNDGFGYAVGLSGTAGVVGAWKDDDGGLDAGSAYLFQRGIGGVWSQLDKVIASDIAAGDAFGAAVGISGNTAVIGAPFDDGHGSAYVFRNASGSDWGELDKLIAADAAPGDQFGFSVAISGNRAIVGAWMDGGGIGSAYIFRDNGVGVWNQVDKITSLDASAGQRFGYSVAISGNRAIIGAPFDGEGAPLGGAAYIFQEDGLGNWNQIDKILADDASVGAQLGSSVGMSESSAIAGAIGESTNGALAGAAYLFEPTGANWNQVEKFTASDAGAADRFGQSVAVSNGLAIVGAYQENSGGFASGSAYMFRADGGVWNQVAKLSASDRQSGDALGFSAAASNGVALVGAPLSNAGTDSGAAYLYASPAGLPGDFNKNGSVDAADYTLWRDSLGQSGANLAADGNGDGAVTQADYQLWKKRFGLQIVRGASTLASARAVPEASTIALLCFGVVAPLRERRQRCRFLASRRVR